MGLFDDLIPKGDAPLQITVNKGPDYSNAISSVESGGNYGAIGPPTGKGRAYGKYQVMDFNVGPWTEEILGQRLTPQQFLGSKEAQDAVFQSKFGGYVNKYGPEGAARAWFAGEGGMNDPNRRDVLGTSAADYARKFTAAQPQPQSASQPAPQSGGMFDDLIPRGPVAERFGELQPAPTTMKPALEQRAIEMMRGEPLQPAAQMAIDAANTLPAASQGTSPNVEAYGGRLVSREIFEDDGGNVLYRDPQTGQVRPTDNSTQVAIRDPVDGVVKVFERSEKTNENPVVGVSRVLAPGLAAGAVTARAAIGAKTFLPKASDIFATSKPYYRAFKEEAGKVEVPVETAAGIAERIRAALTNANLIPELAQPVYSAVGILDKGEPITLDALQNIKRVVGRAFNSPDKNVRDAAAVASGEIAKVIGEVSKSAGQNLKTADAIHSTARSVQDLQRKGDVADLRAGRAGYGGNAVNTMRQVLSPIVQRATEGKTTGFKPDEIQAMREIVEGTGATNAFRLIGQLSPTSGLGALRSAGAGGTAMMAGASGGMALAIPALGAVSNKIAALLTGRQIDRLKELVAKRSPAYAEAVAKAVTRYEQAQMEIVNQPTPAKLAAYVSASRALSSGLTRDGIQVTSGNLMRAIQGPAVGRAEDNQPPVPRPPGQ